MAATNENEPNQAAATTSPADELREALRRLDGLIEFCQVSADEDGDLLVEAHLLRADLEAIRGCVRAAQNGSRSEVE